MYLILLHKAIQRNTNRFLAKALQEFFSFKEHNNIKEPHSQFPISPLSINSLVTMYQ